MIKQQGIKAKLKSRQQGAVAIIVAICLVVLIGMLGLVLDLGHLYVSKTELQNAADAAALSGAKELNGTKLGVQNAITAAVNVAKLNNFDFQKKPVGTSDADGGLVISVGNCPDDIGCGWVLASTVGTDADAVGKTFLKVETGNRDFNTWFIHVLPGAPSSTKTFGMAVAGRYVTPITPIGVCSLRDAREAWVKYGSGSDDEYKVEFGYMRGVNYDLNAINEKLSGLASGDKLYIHPTATSQADCQTSQGNADFAAPFLCTGRSSIGSTFNSKVFTNTGLAAGKSIGAINTRFDLYVPALGTSLDYTVCAPDANIKQYSPAIAANWMTSTSTPLDQAAIYGLADWLAGPVGGGLRSTLPSVPPGALVTEKENKGGCDDDCSDNYGVIWSYAKPVKKSGNFTTDDWAMLYPSGLSSPALAYKEPSPYKYGLDNTGNSTYFLPPSHTGSTISEPRRILNALIIDCPATSGGICQPLDVLGVGKFFMQRTADNSTWITGEFAGLVPEAELTSVIRLYR